MRRRSGPEEVIHRAIVKHLQARAVPGVLWWHSANGGFRTKAEAGILKALGVRPGVHDLVCIVPPNGSIRSLEVKAKGEKPTPHQRAFGASIDAAGGEWAWADNLDDALAILEGWGVLRPNKAEGRAAA